MNLQQALEQLSRTAPQKKCNLPKQTEPGELFSLPMELWKKEILSDDYLSMSVFMYTCGFVNGYDLMKAGCISGNIEMIDMALRLGKPIYEGAAYFAVSRGDLGLLTWLESRHFPIQNYLVNTAAYAGSKEMIEYLLMRGVRVTEKVSSEAARGGHMDLLKWLRDNNFPITRNLCDHAIAGGHMDLASQLRRLGYIFTNSTLCLALDQENPAPILCWLRDAGCVFSSNIYELAEIRKNVAVLEWAFSSGYEWDFAYIINAASNGNLDALKWTSSKHIPIPTHCAEIAASKGYLDILKWLHDKGMVFGKNVCFEAARSDNFETLKWLMSVGAPWDERILTVSLKNKNGIMVEHIRNNM